MDYDPYYPPGLIIDTTRIPAKKTPPRIGKRFYEEVSDPITEGEGEQILRLVSEGWSYEKIGDLVGIDRSVIGDFVRKSKGAYNA